MTESRGVCALLEWQVPRHISLESVAPVTTHTLQLMVNATAHLCVLHLFSSVTAFAQDSLLVLMLTKIWALR